LKRLLDLHQIRYEYLNGTQQIKGYDYQSQRNQTTRFDNGALVIPTNQVKGKMAQVLFEPDTALQDSITYDITAWSLPYAYGLKAMASNSKINTQAQSAQEAATSSLGEAMGWGTSYDSFEDGKFLAALIKANIHVRYSQKPLTNSGKN
ncbi:MAG: zinc carboxypeptidase, partial [Flavobacteriaceae bacterium]